VRGLLFWRQEQAPSLSFNDLSWQRQIQGSYSTDRRGSSRTSTQVRMQHFNLLTSEMHEIPASIFFLAKDPFCPPNWPPQRKGMQTKKEKKHYRRVDRSRKGVNAEGAYQPVSRPRSWRSRAWISHHANDMLKPRGLHGTWADRRTINRRLIAIV
jgi:hypothetical protein